MSNKIKKETIRRAAHNKENPYAQISKKMLRDKLISPKSKGVLCYLLSLPSDWIVHPRQIAEDLNIGKDQVYWVLDELIREGYASKEIIKGEKGKFDSVRYEFSEDKNLITVSGKPTGGLSGIPDTDFQTLQKNDLTKTENKIVCADSGPVAPPLHEKIIKNKPDGTSFEVSRDDLIRMAVQTNQDWTINEIDELWMIIYDYPNPIREIIPFCEGIVTNCRKMSAIKKLKEKEKSCKTKIKSPKNESDL